MSEDRPVVVDHTLVDPIIQSTNNNALLKLERTGGGVPRIMEFGHVQLVKCLICDGVAQGMPVCSDCGIAVAVVREIGSENLRKIGEAIVERGFTQFLAMLADKGITEWMKEWLERELKTMS